MTGCLADGGGFFPSLGLRCALVWWMSLPGRGLHPWGAAGTGQGGAGQRGSGWRSLALKDPKGIHSVPVLLAGSRNPRAG